MYNYHAVITGLSKPTLFKQTVMIILIQLKQDHTVTLLRVCWQVVTYPELSLFLLGPFSGLLTARNDIGNFVNSIKSEEEITQTIEKLSPGEKYSLLKNHKKPHSLYYVFPTTHLANFKRSFNRRWLDEYPWMVYSELLHGAFCIACALFCKKRRNKGQFVNRPFTAWHKRTEKCKEHELTQYHQESLQQAEIFTQAVEHPTSTVSTLLDIKKAANVERNRTILKCVLEAVIYCGRQCIALRGDNEKLNESGNPGNVLSLLRLMANHNEIIRIHFEAPQMKCVYKQQF